MCSQVNALQLNYPFSSAAPVAAASGGVVVAQTGLVSGLLAVFTAVMCCNIILLFMLLSPPSLRRKSPTLCGAQILDCAEQLFHPVKLTVVIAFMSFQNITLLPKKKKLKK